MTTEPVSPVRSAPDPAALAEKVREKSLLVNALLAEIRKVIVGQDAARRAAPRGLLADGHLLLEGVPGLAKTLAVTDARRTASTPRSRGSSSPRTSCRPTSSARSSTTPSTREFVDEEGSDLREPRSRRRDQPRARPRCSRALLEAMQERQVTIGDATHPLPEPVPRPRHAEPDRAGGHLPPARGAGRPLHAEAQGRLPDEGRGEADPRPHGRDDRGGGVGVRTSRPRPHLDPGAARARPRPSTSTSG